MNCPNCRENLNKIRVETMLGSSFDVDHCGFCAGTWFDPYEINRIPFHEVVRLAKISNSPKKIPTKDTLKCPLCSTLLNLFESNAVPTNCRLYRCPKDLGIWSMQKDLEIFKENQDSARDKSAGEKLSLPFRLSVILIPATALVLLLGLTYITINASLISYSKKAEASQSLYGFQIRKLTPRSAAVFFFTSKPFISSLEYGYSPKSMETLKISKLPSFTHSIILYNLEENQNYTFSPILKDNSGQAFKMQTSVYEN